MITIRKLKTLPRETRLRKTVSVLAHLELRERDLASHRRYLHDLAATIVTDRSVPQDIRELAESLVQHFAGETEPGTFTNADATARRAINTLRHELNAFLGRSASDWDVYDEATAELDASRRTVREFYLYLEDLRSPFNVGAIFRAAESFGVKKIIVSPHTADPGHARARRASMSTVDVLPWHRASLEEAFHDLSAAGTPTVFALETGGELIERFDFPEPGIMVIGSEELGVSPGLLARADASGGRVSIRTGGVKGSLNVSVAAGIALHAWWSQGFMMIS
jgi:TrmH family RNA methyltransferase